MGIDFRFTMKSCFVYSSMSHLIKDCTFHEDRMAKKSVLPNNVGKGTGHRESRPIWNNVQRINHQKKFAPTAVFTRSGRIPVSAAKPKAVASTISAVKRNGVTDVKASAGCVWRQKVNDIDQIFKDNRWIYTRVDYGHLHQALKNKGIVDSRFSSHIKGNKAYLVDYQEINDGGFVAFGSSRVTDEFSRCSWVFFLASKDETSKVLKPFITTIENQINKKVKVIRCDNGTEFKNRDLDEFYGMKGIKREYSNGGTPQQNGIAERKNKTLIKAARTMLADSLLPITFWAEAVNTAFYVLNRALVTKHHNKTPFELLNGRSPRLDFMRPFGYLVTILNTLDPLRKFKGNQTDKNAGPQDINGNAGTQDTIDVGKQVSDQHHIVLPLWSSIFSTYKNSDDKAEDDKPKDDTCLKTIAEPCCGPSSPHPDDTLLHVAQDDSQIPNLEDTVELKSTDIFTSAYDADLDTFTSLVHNVGTKADFNNRESSTIMEPEKVAQALDDESWVEAIQDELLQFSLQKVWRQVDMPYRKKTIGTKWVYRNKKDERGIVVRNKARLMDVKSTFLYDTIEEEVYVSQPPDFIDPQYPHKAYKNGYKREITDKTLFIKTNKDDIMLVQMSSIGELTFFLGLQVKQSKEGIFISQDKYVAEILKKFYFSSVGTASTPIETQKPLVKDEEAAGVDVHLYRSMIRSLMYLKGQPKLSLSYPIDSPFDLEAYSDSDYARANLDRKFTTGADLAFTPQHNMVAYLEKTKGNVEFHQIVDFLTSSSIHHALTISPTIYASNIEHFWNTANSQTINDEKQIHATVDGNIVVVT
uniref:Ribonuclease H-like domain-containing protein n=1 Tax=Tanacetum cinerariifolium TaxID=118510 RepID=A0A6L2J4R4_TANCI|nr:ribonuclease H-like domain-containing protein [Tanacetum cinerariifolium]